MVSVLNLINADGIYPFFLSVIAMIANGSSMRTNGSIAQEWTTNEAYRFICLLETYKYNFMRIVLYLKKV